MNNHKKLKVFLPLALCAVTLAGCTNLTTTNIPNNTITQVKSISDTVTFESEDYYMDWKSQSYQTVSLDKGLADIKKSGVYEITGTLKDGSLVVDVDKSADPGVVYLVLNNANISSTTSSPIYIKGAKKVVLILENGTTNTLYQGNTPVVDSNNEPSAALFSKSDLTITGNGTLTVTSDYNDGIASKDMLKITDGTIQVKAKADGIVGKDVLAVKKGNIAITAGKDGVRSTNDTEAGKGNILIADGTFEITSNNDAVQAYGTLEIDGGTFNITTGGGYSKNTTVHADNGPGGMGGAPGGKGNNGPQATKATATDTESQKGLKADGDIIISNGVFKVSAYDDSVNASGGIAINGGTFTLQSGEDGIHSDTDITMNDGTITIENSYEGVEGKNITINNGNISLISSDDGFNVNNSSGLLTISGGEISINSGGDGTDSNGSIKMTGGTVYVDGPTANNNGAIDYDGSFNISGGTILAAGSSGMAESPGTDSSQPSILMYYSTTQSAGTAITLKDSNENPVATYTPTKLYASVALSSPGLKTGQSYTLYSGSTKVVTFTLSSTVTYLNESGVTQNQSRGPGGMKGGRQGGSGAPGGMPGAPGGRG